MLSPWLEWFFKSDGSIETEIQVITVQPMNWEDLPDLAKQI
jgi:hypothetical protein